MDTWIVELSVRVQERVALMAEGAGEARCLVLAAGAAVRICTLVNRTSTMYRFNSQRPSVEAICSRSSLGV
jgi:hypothetical protein